VTQPEQQRFTPKQAEELSVANGEGPAVLNVVDPWGSHRLNDYFRSQ